MLSEEQLLDVRAAAANLAQLDELYVAPLGAMGADGLCLYSRGLGKEGEGAPMATVRTGDPACDLYIANTLLAVAEGFKVLCAEHGL